MPSYDDIFRDDEDEDSDGGDSGNESDGGSEPSGKRRRFDEVGFILSLLMPAESNVCWLSLIWTNVLTFLRAHWREGLSASERGESGRLRGQSH